MKNKFKIIYTALLMTLITCFSFHANAQSCADDSYQFSDMVAIFQSNGCNVCHGAQGGLDLSNYNNVINGGTNGVGGCGPYTTALDYLIAKVDGTLMAGDGCGQAMPLGNTYGMPGMSTEDIAALQAWVDAGAPQLCPIPPCTDIVVSAQPVCNGTAGTFDIQINSITGGDDIGDPTGTYTVTDGTNTITYPTETTITGLTYTAQNDKITLTITDNDDTSCPVTYDVLQLECLDQTICSCDTDNPFSINAQAAANGDGYSMVYLLTDVAGAVIAVNQAGSFGAFANDGATYNAYAYNVADDDLTALEAALNGLIGSSVDPSLTASQAAPFDEYCYAEVTASFTENCEFVDVVIGDQTICEEDATGFDLTALEPAGQTGGVWLDTEEENVGSTVDVANGDILIYVYTDDNGCESRDTIMFTVNETLSAVADVFLCPEDAVTDYDLTPNEPAGANGTWNVANPTSVDVTSGGTFVYTFDGANGCDEILEVAIGVLNGVSFTLDDISLCEGQTGILEPSGLDAAGNYTYAWSDGATTPTITVNFSGDYTLMVMDDFGCVGTATATVTVSPNIVINIGDQQLCPASATGFDLTTLEPVGQTGGTWSAAMPTSIDIADGDSFTYTYTDGNSCEGSTTVTFTINDDPTIDITDQTICADAATGYDLTVLEPAGQTGGTWTDASDNTVSIVDVTDGDTFTYTFEDANGCGGSVTITINVNAIFPIVDFDVVCAEGALSYDLTGFEPIGSTGTWAGVSDPMSADVSTGGSFTYNYTDGNGCSGTVEVSITVLDEIQVTANATCDSASEGIFYVEIQDISGGSQTSDYTVEADGISVNYIFETVVLGPFTYTDHNEGITLNITSADGCTSTYDVLQLNCADQEVCDCTNIDTPYTITAQAAANGNGYSMIYALVNTDNGNAVEAVNDTGIFADLADNTNYTVYAFNVEDVDIAGFTTELNSLLMISAGDEVLTNVGAFANYCYESASADFIEDCACEVGCDNFEATGTFTDLTCNGDASGSINLTTSGGLSPYTYTWNNGADTEDLTGLDAGTYMVTVNDSNAETCEAILTFVISQPDAIGITNVNITDATCGEADGTIVIAVQNGVPPLTYGITELGISQANNTIVDIPEGDYTVTVTDANGCEAFTPVTIAGTDAPAATITIDQSPDCGENNGSAIVAVTGGTPPYNYLWSDGQTTETATNLGGGTYTVTVTDGGGCSVTESIVINEVGCEFTITNTFSANDGCKCNNDQTANGTGDGTFEETVTVLAPAGLIIRADITSTGIVGPVNNGLSSSTPPIEFYETFPGRYILIFNHIDRVGYTINVEYSVDGGDTFLPAPSGAGGQLSITNVCAYPVLAFNPPLEAAYCEDDGIVVIGVIETSDNVDFMAQQGYPAVQLNNGEPEPSPATFDPSTFGTATYTFSGFYNYENGPGVGGTLENPAVSLNPCATYIRVNVPVNPVPASEAICLQMGGDEFLIDVDPNEDYETPENLMYRIGDSGPYQMSDQFIVGDEGDYEMMIVDVASACEYMAQASCLRALPIELIGFEGECANSEYRLTWTTATEEGVSHFVVERSIDGQNYARIAEVPAVGNSTAVQKYDYTDFTGLSRQYYYRLRVVEFSGKETISRIESVSCLSGGFGVLDVYPNPTQDEVAITFEVTSRDRLSLSLVDVLGRTVDQQELTPNVGLNRTVIDMTSLPSAMYYIVLENDTQQSIEKVVKK